MTHSATNPDYYISPGALTFQENANNSSEYVIVSAYSRTLMRVRPVKIDGVMVIDWAADLEYKNWQITAKNTKFSSEYANSALYIYVRLNRNDTSDALVIFTPKNLDILGNEIDEEPIEETEGLEGTNEETPNAGAEFTPANAEYLYIQIGGVTAPESGRRSIHYDSGNLDTAQGREENASGALAEMFQVITENATKYIEPQLDFIRIAIAQTFQLGQKIISAITDSISSVSTENQPSTLPTVKGVVDYIASIIEQLNNKYLRKDQADGTAYKLTMGEAEVTGDLTVGDDAAVGGDLSVDGASALDGNVTLGGWIGSDDFVSGLVGWRLDKEGNLEAETIHSRSAIITDELRVNRQQGQEGDTVFSDNDQIITVEEREEQDHSITYILTLKEKWEGYFTSQQFGNIIRGKINTLAAKDAGVSDYTADEYHASQGVDNGGNYYYTSYMRVINTHNTAPSMLEQNQIQVSLYGDSDVPMAKNYPPCPLMTIVRAGCWQNPDEAGISSDERNSRIRRQSYFMISTTDGRIVKLTGVDTPKLRETNFGTTLGKLPEFIENWTIADRLIDGRDYLYAQGVVVGDFIKVDIQGDPIVQYVDCGEWYDGGAQGATPTVGHGIYLLNEHNNTSLQWETHDVWHMGMKWRCMQHQPVMENGVAHYYEPKWNSAYWQFLEGDNNFRMEFVSSRGFRFHRGSVSTTITPHLYVGNEEITNEIADTYWSWTRSSDTRTAETIEDDEDWNDDHMHMKALALTDRDMPVWWATDNRIKFICHVQISDGKTLTFEL